MVLSDRVRVDVLRQRHPDILEKLQQTGKRNSKNSKRVQFCGIVSSLSGNPVVFIPRHLLSESESGNLAAASLTMKALKRYCISTPTRVGIELGILSQLSKMLVSFRLAEDFVRNGLYSERVRYPSRDMGKPDWRKTIVKELAMITSNGEPIYNSLRTTKIIDTHQSHLALIHAAVLKEISSLHSWWLDGLASRSADLLKVPRPVYKKKLWAVILKNILPNLYSRRSMFLARNLIDYLEENSSIAEGNILLGLEDFSSVWEGMLSSVLPNAEQGWNKKLPSAGYILDDTFEDGELLQSSMRMDTVIRTSNVLRIVDAKYYGAEDINSVPSWPDIVKQLYYHKAMESVVEADMKITNCFVFPCSKDSAKRYSSVRLFNNNKILDVFPVIDCVYLDVMEVMKAYTSRRKLNFPFQHASEVEVNEEEVT